jgi:hypothetical protein
MSMNQYVANRRFERAFLSNTDPNEPPDDRKTLEEVARYAHKRHQSTSGEPKGRLISTIHYFPDEKRVGVEHHLGTSESERR